MISLQKRNKMVLSDDICRCRDDECPERETCERWLQRKEGGVWLVHTDTFRDMFRWVSNGKCIARIPKRDELSREGNSK